LTPREKRELLVIRNVREELLAHVEDVSLDEETFEDLRDQLEEALDTLSQGLDSALVVNCQGIVSRYMFSCFKTSCLLINLFKVLFAIQILHGNHVFG
jgi:hypothetical protein